MRVRVPVGLPVPPVELTSYRKWCASRGLEPYGNPTDAGSMRAAVAGYVAWEAERAAWAVAHKLGEDDVGMVVEECSVPWDVDVM